ncbi:MAG: NAD(P)-dependent oxidoreductase [Gammaproteobacteria bacterium]|jgi:UDP-glucose 4-epimerase|nr:NAD(P)-dependent oxidoreductase [Gammaproteobacteria bacterium]
MTLLVTGSAGHLGEALLRTLRAQGRDALGIDIKPSAFTNRVGSIVDRDFVDECMTGVTAVLHTATLHKPHVATHSRQHFVDTNVTGTLNLLEASVRSGVGAFIFTSTTSTFGEALRPPPDQPAVWITEDVVPVVKNIYGATKTAAEDLCRLFYRSHHLPCLVLRTSRFFPEPDDDPGRRSSYDDSALKVSELLYRRVDIEDVVNAHLLAIDRVQEIGFDRFIISATTPFNRDDLMQLRTDPAAVLDQREPSWREVFAARGWRMLDDIERVYVNSHARELLGWRPQYDFARAIADLQHSRCHRSELARQIGAKGYR